MYANRLGSVLAVAKAIRLVGSGAFYRWKWKSGELLDFVPSKAVSEGFRHNARSRKAEALGSPPFSPGCGLLPL
jgi:hypothetical protein